MLLLLLFYYILLHLLFFGSNATLRFNFLIFGFEDILFRKEGIFTNIMQSGIIYS